MKNKQTITNNGNLSFSFKYARMEGIAKLFIENGLPALLKTKQVSELFGVHRETIRRWENGGHIQAIRVKRGKCSDRRFSKEEIIYILNNGLRE